MKFKNILLLAGLLLASGLQAMQPLGPGLISTDYSDDSGEESEVEDFPRTIKKYPDQPTRLPKQVETKPAALLYEKDYDKPYIGGVARAPLKDEPSLETGILEYTDKPRAYPALPKGLFTPVPSKQEPETRFYKDIRRAFLTPLSEEPSLAKQPPVYADKPTVLPTTKELTPMETLTPPAPVRTTLPVTVIQPEKPVVQTSPFKAEPAVGIFATLLGSKIQRSEFEVAIANSTNDTYKIIYNNQTLPLAPNQVQSISLTNLAQVALTPIVRSRTAGGVTTTTTISRAIEKQTITLVRTSDNQQFSLNVGRGTNARKQIVIALSITQGNNVIKRTDVSFNPPALGQKVYYVVQVNLLGKDLRETTIEITPTLAQ